MSFRDYYRDRKVLVTGHTGFKGAWLTSWLLGLGAEVSGIALDPPTKPNLFGALCLGDRINHHIADINDSDAVNRVFAETNPDVVFHLAAQPFVRRSYAEPKLTYQTNVLGTLNILQASKDCNTTSGCIVVTSDKCYKNREWAYGYREDDALGGHDPYSASKACAEILTASFRDSFCSGSDASALAVASCRAGNVIGGGDWGEDRLIPDCVKACVDDKAINLRNPNAERPWQHVLEPLAGYLLLGSLLGSTARAQYTEGWNFGPNYTNVISVEECVRLFVKAWGSGDYSISKTDSLHEANFLRLDIGKSLSRLKWEPVLGISETLKWTVDWYKQFYSSGESDLADLTAGQIDSYTTLAADKNIIWTL